MTEHRPADAGTWLCPRCEFVNEDAAKDCARCVRRSKAARDAVDTMWAQNTDWTARTAAARDARWQQYEDEVDPNRQLDEATRAKRAEKARQVHMRKMSRLGVEARRRNAEARNASRQPRSGAA